MAAKRRRSGSLGVPLTEAPGEAVPPPASINTPTCPAEIRLGTSSADQQPRGRESQRLKQPSGTAGDLWPGPLLPARAPPRPEAPAARLCLQSPQPSCRPTAPAQGLRAARYPRPQHSHIRRLKTPPRRCPLLAAAGAGRAPPLLSSPLLSLYRKSMRGARGGLP